MCAHDGARDSEDSSKCNGEARQTSYWTNSAAYVMRHVLFQHPCWYRVSRVRMTLVSSFSLSPPSSFLPICRWITVPTKASFHL